MPDVGAPGAIHPDRNPVSGRQSDSSVTGPDLLTVHEHLAASECGTDLTRDCVWDKIGRIHDWTGGGLQAGQDVGNSKPSTCFAELAVKGGKFVLADIHPNEGIYLCNKGDLLAIKGDYGSGAKCPNPAYASDPKPSNCGS